MIESISLMNVGIIPVYPVKDSDILNYRKGLIAFYEMEDYSLYTRVRDKDCVKNRVKRAKIVRFTLC